MNSHIHVYRSVQKMIYLFFDPILGPLRMHACIQQKPLPVFRVARNLVQKKRAPAYYPARVPGTLVEIGKREKIFHRMFRRGPLRS